MRLLAICALVASACGDNIHPGVFVDTQVASTNLAAGDPVGAKCSIVDANGDPVLDKAGNPLSDSVELDVNFEDQTSFTTDASGQVIAAKVGTAIVRCAAPSLGLVDDTPVTVTITAGAPVRVITRLDQPTAIAGEPDGAQCVAFDAFDNPVTGFTQAFALSPSGAGETTTDHDVTANLAGEYEVSCVVAGAAAVVPDDLVVLPALPASLVGVLDPERSLYAVDDEVTLVAAAFDEFGNRVDDVDYDYGSTPSVPAPSPARFVFAQDGTFGLSADVTSSTKDNQPLNVTLPAVVDSTGPAIECRRIDTPTVAADAYMIQLGATTATVPVHVSAAAAVKTVTIGGTSATLNPNTGNFEAGVTIGFGINFVDVIATDTNNVQNSTTCFILAASTYTAETGSLAGNLALRLDQNAIGDPSTSGLNSLNDIFFTVLGSQALRNLVDTGLQGANPINGGGCGVFACNPNVNYNAGTINWDQPATTLSLIPGGLRATVDLPNVRLTVRACGTTCCIGGSTITATADHIRASVDFSLSLQGGKLRTAVSGQPTVTVGNVNLDGSGFCGFLVNLLQGFFTGTVKSAIQNALTSFINSNVGPLLDQVTSSLDITTLGQSFQVPRLDNTGTVTLGLGVAFSSFDITTNRALLGIGTKFTPAQVAQNRASLGIPQQSATALLDPPGTTGTQPVAISAYEGVLNQVLHGLWRGGYFQAAINIGGGTAVIDSELPPVATIDSNNTATLMLGGVTGTLQIPGIIDTPIHITFGGRASATVSMNGNALTFGNLTLQQLFVSFNATLSQSQRNAMENFLTSALQDTLASALNDGLPAFPIPSFTLPASVSQFGLPAGAELGIVNPILSTANSHCVLDGGFGVRQ